MINYCNEAQVAAALNMNPTSSLSAPANAGTNVLNVQGGTWYPGQRVAIDHFQDDAVAEVALIQSVSGNQLTLSANLANNHVLGAPVVEVTAINKVLASASRMVDSITYYENVGFNQETLTETSIGYVQSDGSIYFTAKKPTVQSISSITVKNTAIDTPVSISTGNWDIDGYTVNAYVQNSEYVPPMLSKQVCVTMNYTGGYSSLPDAIVRAAVVFAARFFKEKDSGFSDMIGNTDLGIMQYKKGVPAEVQALIKPYIRVTP